jgi:RNA-binding protein Tab2/Atab2
MIIWQIDFYRRPQNQPPALWDLLICSPTGDFRYEASCLQSEANSTWLTSQLQLAASSGLPEKIQVFRPQSLSLVEVAATNLNIKVEATRRTPALKEWLREKQYPITIDKLPPIPIPENLLGDEWRFGAISAIDIADFTSSHPIPILEVPDFLLPMHLGLASTQPIPGIVIYGGRQSMRLARWLKETNAQALNYIPGVPDGLILEAGLSDRWVVATFEDKDVTTAAKNYEQRKQQSQGLHFLLIQPDDSGMTYSGFWLFQAEE